MNPAQKEQKTEKKKQEEKKRKSFRDILETPLVVIKELFIFSLVFYLILFIFETIFPGFVSNNFNLNWVLGVVLGLGVISAFAPEEPKKEKGEVTRVDYLFTIALGIIGGGLIFYKIELEGYIRWAIAIISGVLIVALGLAILTTEEEQEEVSVEKEISEVSLLSLKNLRSLMLFPKLVLSKKISLPIVFILIFLIFTGFLIPKNFASLLSSLRESPLRLRSGQAGHSRSVFTSPTPMPTSIPTPASKLVEPSSKILIRVLNGGAEVGAAGEFGAVLKQFGFGNVEATDAANFNYKNATIKFRPEDKEQASLVKDLLKDEYFIISEAPSGTTSAEITVVLGAREPEEVTELELE